MDLFLLERQAHGARELVEQRSNGAVIDIGGILGQHFASKNATGSRWLAASPPSSA